MVAFVQLVVVLLWLFVGSTRGDAITDLIERDPKYRGEIHDVTTPDGFILGVHHLVRRDNNLLSNMGPKYPPAILVHGLTSTAADWLRLGPGKALPFVLADRGHDVWLPNTRGNPYSQRHTRLTNLSAEFWEYSIHEMGVIDTPAVVDYVLSKNTERHNQVYLVGHSEGATTSLIFLSERPEYNARVGKVFALSPATNLHPNSDAFLKMMSPFNESFRVWFRFLGIYDLMSYTKVKPGFCSLNPQILEQCEYMFKAGTGVSNFTTSKSVMTDTINDKCATASMKQVTHYGQLASTGEFRKYDYSPYQIYNYQLYGSMTPPQYDLSKITSPFVLYYATNDVLVGQAEVEYLKGKLQKAQTRKLVGWNHLDFTYCECATSLYYEIAQEIESATITKKFSFFK